MTLPVWQGLAAQESSGDIVVLASPSVTVTDRTTGAQPNLFSDRAGNTGIGNPFTADADGSIEFYVAPGRYKVEAAKGGETVTWDDQLIGTLHGIDQPSDDNLPIYDDANDRYTQIAPKDLNAKPTDPEHATDSGTDTFVSATNTTPPADGVKITRDFQSANTTTTPTLDGKTLTTRNGSALWAGAVSGVHDVQYASGTDTYLVLEPRWQLAPFWAGHIDGLELSNGTDADHDIDITTGVCWMRDGSGNRKAFELTSSLTKQIDANWAEGTDAGGFPSGLTLAADTTYHVFLIGKNDGSVDAGFDTSTSASNLLSDASNYSWFRRIGSVLTDGSSNIIGFSQHGDEFLLDEETLDYNETNPGTLAALHALTVPSGIQVRALHLNQVIDSPSDRIVTSHATSPDQSDVAPSSGVFTARTPDIGDTSTGVVSVSQTMKIIRTSVNAQIRVRLDISDGAITSRGMTAGWIDDRGRNQ